MHWYTAISAKHCYRQIRRHLLMAKVHVSACHCIWLFISYCGLLWLIRPFVGRGFLTMNKHWEKAFTCRRYRTATLPLVRWKMNPSQLLSSSACLLSFKHTSSWLSDYTQGKNCKDLYFLHSFCFSQLLWLCPFPIVLLTYPLNCIVPTASSQISPMMVLTDIYFHDCCDWHASWAFLFT